MTTKHPLLIIGAGALLLACVAVQYAPLGTRGYCAVSMVVTDPYTNVFFTRAFKSHVTETIPGVLDLRITPRLSSVPRPGVQVLTNGVGIEIRTTGATPEDAQRAANEAATQLCRTVRSNYGVRGEVSMRANSARRYSYFHDSFQPAVGRFFKHEQGMSQGLR